jgi:hypothetical protein
MKLIILKNVGLLGGTNVIIGEGPIVRGDASRERNSFLKPGCEASIKIRPKYSYAYNNLGTAYLGMGEFAAAITALNKR